MVVVWLGGQSAVACIAGDGPGRPSGVRVLLACEW
jgi:hypothetical protein